VSNFEPRYFLLPTRDICWICSLCRPLTAEHKYKAGIVRKLYKNHDFPLYVGRPEEKMRLAQGPASKELKFTSSICEQCNTSTTQKADLAFDSFDTTNANCGDNQLLIDANVKQYCAEDSALYEIDLFRFFAKHFGCQLYDFDYPIPIHLAKFVRGENVRNCVGLDVFLEAENNLAFDRQRRAVAYGGLGFMCDKAGNYPTGLFSSLLFGNMRYTFYYRYIFDELNELNNSGWDFWGEALALCESTLNSPLDRKTIANIGLRIHS
jgi:hypothetical protein